MKFVIPGASGQIGAILSRDFTSRGHDVVVLSRTPRPASAVRTVTWDARSLGPWAREIDGADVVINLAGCSVNCRCTDENKRQILASRIDSTRAVGQAIAAARRPPQVWLQASTATIYAHTFGPAHDEATGVIGGGEPGAPENWRFSIEVAQAWERAATDFDLPHTRLVRMRSAITLSPDAGGILDVLLGLVRAGLGGASGDGRHFVSWIHDRDFVRAVDWLIARSDVVGPVNLVSPHQLPNAEFMRALREARGVRVGLPASKWMLAVGAVLMRTETELVLKSRRVAPGRLLESGFVFEHPDWADAARDLCRRWRVQHHTGQSAASSGLDFGLRDRTPPRVEIRCVSRP